MVFWITRTMAYGALPAFAYLILIVALGGGEPAMLFPVVYLWIVMGLLITGWVVRRRRARTQR